MCLSLLVVMPAWDRLSAACPAAEPRQLGVGSGPEKGTCAHHGMGPRHCEGLHSSCEEPLCPRKSNINIK